MLVEAEIRRRHKNLPRLLHIIIIIIIIQAVWPITDGIGNIRKHTPHYKPQTTTFIYELIRTNHIRYTTVLRLTLYIPH
jgi:hypothetical protein